ncbi:MAG TPA: ExsB family transcriptional regulator, partial [Candidatus Eisenbacteria bacterium]|nr:ExsB family transcriptional regulator [Candidatus Eisenbacteria bacterium]
MSEREDFVAIREIRIEDLKPEEFIEEKVAEIAAAVGGGLAVNALSGGVDSAAVTMLGHRALGGRLETYFVENGIMRQGEPERIKTIFEGLGVPVEIVDARDVFFGALKGLTDPEEKREAITESFYKKVFGELVRTSGAKHLLQGTNYTDVEETVAGIKRQHNILEQLGIDTEAVYGYK